MGRQPLSATAERYSQTVTLWARLRAYPGNDDRRAAACNWIALVVASNQPLYPLYVRWIVGGDWRVSFWTFLSTPFFAAIPAVARRKPLMARALLPLTGIANGLIALKAFGPASGVALFLIPCALIALLAFRRHEWLVSLALVWGSAAAYFVGNHLGPPIGRFDQMQYASFVRLNAYTVVALTIMTAWTLGRARRER